MDEDDLMRSLYLASLYNFDRRISGVNFKDNGVEVIYTDHSKRNISFTTLDKEVKKEDISKQLDNMLEVCDKIKNENSEKKKENKVKVIYEEIPVIDLEATESMESIQYTDLKHKTESMESIQTDRENQKKSDNDKIEKRIIEEIEVPEPEKVFDAEGKKQSDKDKTKKSDIEIINPSQQENVSNTNNLKKGEKQSDNNEIEKSDVGEMEIVEPENVSNTGNLKKGGDTGPPESENVSNNREIEPSESENVSNTDNPKGKGKQIDDDDNDKDKDKSENSSDEENLKNKQRKFKSKSIPIDLRKSTDKTGRDVLTGNKLRVSQFYRELLPYETKLKKVAPFYDSNSGIRKVDYIKNLIKHLEGISKSGTMDFNVVEIKGALPELEFLQEGEDNLGEPSTSVQKFSRSGLQDQMKLLRHEPQIPQNLRPSLDESEAVQTPISIFSTLMSTCYKSINKINMTTYSSEVSRRMSLRFLYEFEQAYNFLKEWVSQYAIREKGTKTATQVWALLTGECSPQDLLKIGDIESTPFQIEHIQGEKRKKGEQSGNLNLSINIPGFSGSISSRKLKTFIAAGPRLMKLLQTLNNSWALLDIIDDVSITWLENFNKDEWKAFINEING